MQWRLAAVSADNIQSWGQESVVYHPQSGDTHLLDVAAAHIIQSLSKNKCDTATLCAGLASQLDVDINGDFEAYVDELLVELTSLSLIERE